MNGDISLPTAEKKALSNEWGHLSSHGPPRRPVWPVGRHDATMDPDRVRPDPGPASNRDSASSRDRELECEPLTPSGAPAASPSHCRRKDAERRTGIRRGPGLKDRWSSGPSRQLESRRPSRPGPPARRRRGADSDPAGGPCHPCGSRPRRRARAARAVGLSLADSPRTPAPRQPPPATRDFGCRRHRDCQWRHLN
jgi:hypothetical protein